MLINRRLTACCLVLVVAAACAARTSIADVRARATELGGRQVTISGKVVDTLTVPLVDARYYQVDDGSGELWVETRSELPAEGAEVRATGSLSPGFKVGSVEMGLVLQESKRR
jgi:hypothetical protein